MGQGLGNLLDRLQALGEAFRIRGCRELAAAGATGAIAGRCGQQTMVLNMVWSGSLLGDGHRSVGSMWRR